MKTDNKCESSDQETRQYSSDFFHELEIITNRVYDFQNYAKLQLKYHPLYTIKLAELRRDEPLKYFIANFSSLYSNELELKMQLDRQAREYKKAIKEKDILISELKSQIEVQDGFISNFHSNTEIIPYMAQILADYETIGLEKLAFSLDWGHSQRREEKVKAIREIRKDAKAMVEKNMEAKYQLAYLLNLFPNLEDVIECEFQQLPPIDIEAVSDYDKARDFLSKEEYSKLSTTERNQLALDRYINSHNKTKWQIGRDYELYIGYLYSKKGYSVDYFGERMGLEDLGRDLICKKGNQTLIIQCKYWSKSKQIHEKHITQLYGTLISYCIENNLKQDYVKALLVTNTCCSDMAKKMAEYLNITVAESVPLKEYPRIKCNVGHDEFGNTQKIYHLPFDQQYDTTKITEKGEFFAHTVKEAEEAGFRRANKWFNL